MNDKNFFSIVFLEFFNSRWTPSTTTTTTTTKWNSRINVFYWKTENQIKIICYDQSIFIIIIIITSFFGYLSVSVWRRESFWFPFIFIWRMKIFFDQKWRWLSNICAKQFSIIILMVKKNIENLKKWILFYFAPTKPNDIWLFGSRKKKNPFFTSFN